MRLMLGPYQTDGTVATADERARLGARRDERADVMIEITAAAARKLNNLRSADPHYTAALEDF